MRFLGPAVGCAWFKCRAPPWHFLLFLSGRSIGKYIFQSQIFVHFQLDPFLGGRDNGGKDFIWRVL